MRAPALLRLVASQGNDKDDPRGGPDQSDPADDDARQSEIPESWIYDGLDRRDARLVEVDGTTKLRERSYIGTTELLSRELD